MRLGGPVGGSTYTCRPLPAACAVTSQPTCACLAGEPCGNCQMSGAGDLTTRCDLQ
jgi:hypothetical protein